MYQNLASPHPSTRAADGTPCQCTVCQIARFNRPPGAGGFKDLPLVFKSLIFPGSTIQSSSSPDPDHVKLCKKCFAVIGRGRSHVCTKTEMRNNLSGIVKSRSKKSKGKVVASGLRAIFEDEGHKRGGATTLPTGGTPMQVTMGIQTSRRHTKNAPRWSHDSLKRLQSTMNLSYRAIK